MVLQKGSLNGHPILEDSASSGVPETNASEDGGDIVAMNAAVLATRRPTHVAPTLAAMKALSTTYLIDNQTYRVTEYVTGIGKNSLFQYHSTGRSGVTLDTYTIAGDNADDYFVSLDEPQTQVLTSSAPAITPGIAAQIDASSNAVNATLGAGDYLGQFQPVVITDATNASSVVIANHIEGDPLTINFTVVETTLLLMWQGMQWVTVSLTGEGANTPPDIEYYQTNFDTAMTTYKTSNFDPEALSGVAVTYYTFQYVLEGTLAMYEATLDTTYLDYALDWVEDMIDQADYTDSQGFKNWDGPVTTYGGSVGYMIDDFQASTGMARCAMIILEDLAGVLDSSRDARAEAVYNFVRDHIIEKWFEGNRVQDAWLRNQVQSTSPVYEWNDKVSLSATTMCYLRRCNVALGSPSDSVSQAGTDPDYDDYLTVVAEGFKGRLIEADTGNANCDCFGGGASVGTLVWDCDEFGPFSTVTNDVSHANRTPVMCIALHEAGYTAANQIELSDLEGLAKLVNEVIWDGVTGDYTTTGPGFSEYIDGDGPGPHADGLVYAGWVQLAAYDDTTLSIMDSTLRAIIGGASNASLDPMDNRHGRTALPGHLARAKVLNPS